jgi:hypothetical protein
MSSWTSIGTVVPGLLEPMRRQDERGFESSFRFRGHCLQEIPHWRTAGSSRKRAAKFEAVAGERCVDWTVEKSFGECKPSSFVE